VKGSENGGTGRPQPAAFAASQGRRASLPASVVFLAGGQLAEVKDEDDPAPISWPSRQAHGPLGKTFRHRSRVEILVLILLKIVMYQ